MKRCALLDFSFSPYTPALALDDALNSRQANSSPREIAGRVQALEGPKQLAFGIALRRRGLQFICHFMSNLAETDQLQLSISCRSGWPRSLLLDAANAPPPFLVHVSVRFALVSSFSYRLCAHTALTG